MITNFILKYSAYIIFPLTAFLVSVFLTKICILFLPSMGMLDIPRGERRIHKKSVPKGGGIAIIIAFLGVWLIFLASRWGYFKGTLKLEMFDKLAVLSLCIGVLGILDDRFELRARYKFIGQLIIASAAWFWGIRLSTIFALPLPDSISLILTVFWIVSFINAFNLIDGMDGLASGLGIISAFCMATVFAVSHFPNDTVVILCLAGACGGFLIFNFHPARIFLGDTGSMFLGFIFAVIGIISSNKSVAVTSILVPMLAAGVPIFDVVLAVWRRFTLRFIHQNTNEMTKTHSGKISEGDREHLHHRLLNKGEQDQRKTALKIYLIAVIFAIAGILNIMQNGVIRGLSYLLILALVFTIVSRIANIELWNTGKAIINGLDVPKKSILISLFQPVIDFVFIVIIFLLCRFLFMGSLHNETNTLLWYHCLFLHTMPIVLILNISNTYKRSWFFGGAPDYIYMFKWLLVSYLAVFVIEYLIGINAWRSYIAEHLLFFSLVTIVLFGEKLFLRFLKGTLINELHIKKERNLQLKKILLCGAGVECRHYINKISGTFEEVPYRIIGIIDDDPIFHGQILQGTKVLGILSEIDKIYEKYNFDKVCITKEIDEEQRKAVINFCRKHDIELTEWKSEEVSVISGQ